MQSLLSFFSFFLFFYISSLYLTPINRMDSFQFFERGINLRHKTVKKYPPRVFRNAPGIDPSLGLGFSGLHPQILPLSSLTGPVRETHCKPVYLQLLFPFPPTLFVEDSLVPVAIAQVDQ